MEAIFLDLNVLSTASFVERQYIDVSRVHQRQWNCIDVNDQRGDLQNLLLHWGIEQNALLIIHVYTAQELN